MKDFLHALRVTHGDNDEPVVRITLPSYAFNKYIDPFRDYWQTEFKRKFFRIKSIHVDSTGESIFIRNGMEPGTHIYWNRYESPNGPATRAFAWCIHGNRLLTKGQKCRHGMCAIDRTHRT